MNSTAQILANFSETFPSLQVFLDALAMVVAVFIIGYGVVMLFYDRGHQSGGGASKGGAVISIFVGAILGSVHYFMQSMTNTFFNATSPRTAIGYSAPNGDAATVIVDSVITVAALFGWYWAIKGCYLIHRAGHPHMARQEDMSSGFIRLGAALLATNMLFVTNMIAATGGFNNPLAGAL